MSWVKWGLVALIAMASLALLVLLGVAWIEARQARQNQALMQAPCEQASTTSRAAVIYYSRSGNTALAARHVACLLGASLIALEAPEYSLGLLGLSHALRDAREQQAQITPVDIDLSGFDTLYLGSPVWLYSPAPPIWAFVANHRLDGKRVVLFNKYNSHFAPEYIAALLAKVLAQGAVGFEHRHVLRGRMTRQLTSEQMLQRIDQDWFSNTPPATSRH